jgi:hypothetical protein
MDTEWILTRKNYVKPTDRPAQIRRWEIEITDLSIQPALSNSRAMGNETRRDEVGWDKMRVHDERELELPYHTSSIGAQDQIEIIILKYGSADSLARHISTRTDNAEPHFFHAKRKVRLKRSVHICITPRTKR